MAKDIIMIGGKPFMNYVTAVVMHFTTNNKSKVILKSRGKFISRAVDVAEIVNSRFLTDKIKVNNIQIGSEEFKNNENKLVRVSTIDIELKKIQDESTKDEILFNEETKLEIVKEE